MSEMKELANSLPLCYLLPNSQQVTALPYIDEELPDLKTKIQYLIKTEQSEMPFNEGSYLESLQYPSTPFLDSENFAAQVATISDKKKAEGKDKKISIFDNVASNIMKNGALSEEEKERIQRLVVAYENNLTKYSY